MKIYLKKINDKYLIEIDHSPVVIEIDDKRFLEFKNGWINKKPQKIYIIEKRERVISYGDLSPENYEKEIKKLIQSKDKYDYPVFENLEQEFAYRKFKDEHKPIYEDYEEKIEPEIIEWDITGRIDNEFIIPFRYMGKTDIKDNESLYEYKANPYKMAQKIASKLGLIEIEDKSTFFSKDEMTEKDWSVPSHSRDSLRFTKIGGEYADSDYLPKFYNIYCGTWKECEESYKSHYKIINDMFEKGLKKIKAKGKKYDKKKVLDELDVLKNMVRKIKIRAKSEITPRQVISRIDNFIKRI